MKHSSLYIKWFCRTLFILLAAIMSYVVTRPAYNYAHWVPHRFLKDIGIPYTALLWAETHGDIFLHFFGAAALVLLLSKAQLPYLSSKWVFALVISLCVLAELFQFAINRGFNLSDLLLGISGSFMAYLAIHKNKQLST